MSIKEGYRKVIVTVKKPGDEITSDQEKRLTINIKKPGDGVPYNFDIVQDYACCDESSYSFLMLFNEGFVGGSISPRLNIEVSGGCPPFIWAVEGDALLIEQNVTSERSNVVLGTEVSTAPEGDLVTVTDSCGSIASCRVRTCIDCTENCGGGGGAPCMSEDYIYPTLEKILTTTPNYTIILVPRNIVEDQNGKTLVYIDPVLSGLGGQSSTIKAIYDSDLVSYSISGSIESGGSLDSITIDSLDDLELEIGEEYILVLNAEKCGCEGVAVYKITDGSPPFEINSSLEGIVEEAYYSRLFVHDDKSPGCFTGNVSATDKCGNTTNSITLEATEPQSEGSDYIAINGALGRSSIEVGCDTIVTLSFDYGDLSNLRCNFNIDFVAEAGSTGTLEVEYDEVELVCVDDFLGDVTVTATYPVSATWINPTGQCCASAYGVYQLVVCAGTDYEKVLDEVEIISNGVTAMEWDSKPASLPGGMTGENPSGLFSFTGGDPPFYWEIIDLGWHQNITLLNDVTVARLNYVQTPSACGTFMIQCTDACGSITAVAAVLASGAWRPYLEASLYVHSGYPTPVPSGGGVSMSGDESEGGTIRALIMSVFGDSGLNDGSQASVDWNNGYTFMGYYPPADPREFKYRQRQKGGLKFTEIVAYDVGYPSTCAGYSPKPSWCYCDDIYDYSTKCLNRIAELGYFTVYGCNLTINGWEDSNHGWNNFYDRGGRNCLFFTERPNWGGFTAYMNGYEPHDDVTCFWYRNVWGSDAAHVFHIAGFQVYIYGC